MKKITWENITQDSLDDLSEEIYKFNDGDIDRAIEPQVANLSNAMDRLKNLYNIKGLILREKRK